MFAFNYLFQSRFYSKFYYYTLVSVKYKNKIFTIKIIQTNTEIKLNVTLVINCNQQNFIDLKTTRATVFLSLLFNDCINEVCKHVQKGKFTLLFKQLNPNFVGILNCTIKYGILLRTCTQLENKNIISPIVDKLVFHRCLQTFDIEGNNKKQLHKRTI